MHKYLAVFYYKANYYSKTSVYLPYSIDFVHFKKVCSLKQYRTHRCGPPLFLPPSLLILVR